MNFIYGLLLICSLASAKSITDPMETEAVVRTLEIFPSKPGPHAFDIDWKNVKDIHTSPELQPAADALGLNVKNNSIYSNLGERIVGGSAATTGQFKHHTLLLLSDGVNSYMCGGSLVNVYWVLTAAHCTIGMTSVAVYSIVDLNVGYYWMSYGSLIVSHGAYSGTTFQYDIAMIKLATAMTVTVNTNLINLPRDSLSNDFAGSTATVQGFGRTADASSDTSTILKYVSNTVITNAKCSETFSNIIASQICKSTVGGRGACNGDSGGALTVTSPSLSVVGIVSFGSALGCQLGHPVAYTRVTSFIPWIDSVIQNY